MFIAVLLIISNSSDVHQQKNGYQMWYIYSYREVSLCNKKECANNIYDGMGESQN